LVPQQKQLRFRVMDSQPQVNQIQEQPKRRVHESNEHRRSKAYRMAHLTPGSLPVDE
jgi:hypothetical protein